MSTDRYTAEQLGELLTEALAGPKGSIDSREQMREYLVQQIDATETGILSRWIGHEARKVLNASRTCYQDMNNPVVQAFLDLLLQNYFKEP